MNWELGLYYVGFVTALLLARGLGPLFFFPMLADFLFEIALQTGLLSGWDIRVLVVIYGFGVFLWVLALAGNLRKSTFVVMLLLDLVMVFRGLWPQFQVAGIGQEFWNDTSMAILDVWQMSVAVVVVATVIRSTILAKARGEYVDALTSPRKRFMLPIGAWALVLVIPAAFKPYLPAELLTLRYPIGANVLIWGWVALELPYYIMYRRVKKKFS